MLFGTYNIDKSSFEHYIYYIKPKLISGYLNDVKIQGGITDRKLPKIHFIGEVTLTYM
jgi:hypothetical protein